ncbi:MAG: hypothetical protein HUU50_13300 [Candidatus Brocadiae bacterium]|nr:hypothetical protein [Candidatus Brocadiia bacterium]
MSYFEPVLVNPYNEDPALLIKIKNEKRSFLVDCGSLHRLSNREMQKITHIFITHTHLDHFIGFDSLIRSNIALDKTLYFFGPKLIARQIHCKMLGYTWNLLSRENLKIKIYEIDTEEIKELALFPSDCYQQCHILENKPIVNNILYKEANFFVTYMPLYHRIPCLGYAFTEEDHWHVDKKKLETFAHPPGNWLSEIKTVLETRTPLDFFPVEDQEYSMEYLQKCLFEKKIGQKIAYITDTIFNEETLANAIYLAQDADILYCETHYAQEDIAKAKESYHLTTSQAGTLARKARVKKIVGFHFSPRYRLSRIPNLQKEIEDAFKK